MHSTQTCTGCNVSAVPSDVTTPPTGLRERQKRARRGALVDAAHRLVERHGLEGVTVEAICAEAGVSTRTFFNYFPSKDDAVLGLEPVVLDAEVAEDFATGGPTGRLADDLETLARSLVAAPILDRDRLAAAVELAGREPRLLARDVAWLEQYRLQVEGLLRRRLGPEADDARVELAGMTLMVLVRASVRRWESAGGTGEIADHLSAARADMRALLGGT